MSTAQLLAGRKGHVLGCDEIGDGIARRFEAEGANVVHSGPSGSATTVELPAVEALVDAAIRSMDGLDVLVCNLLPPPRAQPLEHLPPAGLAESQARVAATFAAMRRALPALQASGRGRIVLVGHRYGESINAGVAAYNSAAWSLVGLARTAAVEWGPYQVTTNVLLPVARTAEFVEAQARRPGIIDRLVAQLPLRRLGDPVEDVGGAAAILASDLMCFVNGQVIHADGGQHVAGPVLDPVRFAT